MIDESKDRAYLEFVNAVITTNPGTEHTYRPSTPEQERERRQRYARMVALETLRLFAKRPAHEPEALPAQLLDVHAICDERDRLRKEFFELAHRLMNAGRFEDANEISKILGSSRPPPPDEQRPLSAVQRLHNICDALSEQADESPFTREEWERIDKQTVEDQKRIRELEAEVSTLREHLAEVNRLMSLNCRTVERLQAENGRLQAALDQLGRVREGEASSQTKGHEWCANCKTPINCHENQQCSAKQLRDQDSKP
jgi:uncharacterized coiled-coil DUF342 family protein